MQTQMQTAQVGSSKKQVTKLTFTSKDGGVMNIPGVEGAFMVSFFIPVTEVPDTLDQFMEVNPRVPSRTVKGLLKGPVVAGMLETLREAPTDFIIKNNGIDILAENVDYKADHITATFRDKGLHGLVNGGHTYAAIREAVETADAAQLKQLAQAYVRINIYDGVSADLVAEMAGARNTSKQVDESSLMNLSGEFDQIRRALRGTAAEQSISYFQGDAGPVYISEVLVFSALLDVGRFTDKKHPHGLYNRAALGLRYFKEDLQNDPGQVKKRIQMLPQILELVDRVRAAIPEAAKKNSFKFGMLDVGGQKAGSKKQRGQVLPFTGETIDYRVPLGWVYPIVAAFRANIKQARDGTLEWRMNVGELLKATIVDMVAVCLSEHRAAQLRPEIVGKKEAAYARCYNVIELYLARKRLI